MSSDHIELLRHGYAEWSRDGLEGILPLLDADIEWIQDKDFPGARTYRGHKGVRRWHAWLSESFERLDAEPERFVEAGDDVLVIVRLRLTGRGSGVDVVTSMGHLWTIRQGKGVRLRFFLDPAEALAAVGQASP